MGTKMTWPDGMNLFWNRALSADEVAMLYKDQYAMFRSHGWTKGGLLRRAWSFLRRWIWR